MTKSTARRRTRKAKIDKPKKPYKDFPLTAHPLGYWCKTINRKLHYFGRWGRIVNGTMTRLPGDGWKEALDQYKEQIDDLQAGRTPRKSDGELTIADLCNHFLTAKQALLDNREIVPRTFADYKRITDRLVAFFGKRRVVVDLNASDFAKLKRHLQEKIGPVRLTSDIAMVKMVFRFGYDNDLIKNHVKMGSDFRPPKKHVLRKHRATQAAKLFEVDEIHTLLDAASVQMRAMILLAVNGGFGNHDCGTLPISAVNMDTGWIDFPRPKTGIPRRFPLWSETIDAIRNAMDERPQPKSEDAADLVFVTKYGGSWAKESSANPISAEFRKLLKDLNLYRKGVGFYALRHVFETIGGESKDQIAVNAIMGHADHSMSAVYREKISDDRLRAVTEHVRSWLWPPDTADSDAPASTESQHKLRVVG